ncbi:hypothetical protein D3C73_1410670 [compost metagenome]
MLLQFALAQRGDLVAFAAVTGGDWLEEILFFQQRQGRVNHPRAWHVQTGRSLINGLDQFITVARFACHQRQQHQSQIAMFKHAVTATTTAASAPAMLFAVIAAKVMTSAAAAMMMTEPFFVLRMTAVTTV